MTDKKENERGEGSGGKCLSVVRHRFDPSLLCPRATSGGEYQVKDGTFDYAVISPRYACRGHQRLLASGLIRKVHT